MRFATNLTRQFDARYHDGVQLELFPSAIPLPPFCDRPDCEAAQRHVDACPEMVKLHAYLREIRRRA